MARRAAFGSFLGTAFEYLDFTMYAIVSAVIFSKVFFPATDPALASIGSVATFGVAYIARPIGAFVLGPLGDRIGRQKVTLLTMIGIGTATFLIGCLPGYQTIGFAAPILLVILRLGQGFFVSGEQAGTSTLTMEHAPSKRRAFFVSWVNVGTGVGTALGQLLFIPILALPTDQLLSWGWRVPFLLSAVWTLIVILVRRTLRDSEAFIEAKKDGQLEKFPLRRLFVEYWPNLIRVVLCCLMAAPGSIVAVFVLFYATNTAHISPSAYLGVSLATGLLSTFSIPFWAILADKIGRRPVFAGGLIIGAGMMFPLFLAVNTGNLLLVGVVALLGNIFIMAGQALQLPMYTEMFPTSIRYSGVAVGTQLGYLLAGFAPTISFAIAGTGLNGWIPVAIFAALCLVIAAISSLTSRETRGIMIDEIDDGPSEARRPAAQATRLNSETSATVPEA
ncbi:MAG: Shikimate transporter [Subtercola sp.]|jgi:MFS family permease|nr:Shikimate transporter [Subtercola sp.]